MCRRHSISPLTLRRLREASRSQRPTSSTDRQLNPGGLHARGCGENEDKIQPLQEAVHPKSSTLRPRAARTQRVVRGEATGRSQVGSQVPGKARRQAPRHSTGSSSPCTREPRVMAASVRGEEHGTMEGTMRQSTREAVGSSIMNRTPAQMNHHNARRQATFHQH
jgi:hypothetical protein